MKLYRSDGNSEQRAEERACKPSGFKVERGYRDAQFLMTLTGGRTLYSFAFLVGALVCFPQLGFLDVESSDMQYLLQPEMVFPISVDQPLTDLLL